MDFDKLHTLPNTTHEEFDRIREGILTMSESPLRLGLLPISAEALEGALHLPEGYSIVGMSYDAERRMLNLTLLSALLPGLAEGGDIPRVSLRVTVWYAREDSKYRYYTTEIKPV